MRKYGMVHFSRSFLKGVEEEGICEGFCFGFFFVVVVVNYYLFKP
jgi:hypothetical protein